MKRVAECVALQTILYTVNQFQKIKVYDYGSDCNRWNDSAKSLIFEGEKKDFMMGHEFEEYQRSKVYETRIDEGSISFAVATKYEQY